MVLLQAVESFSTGTMQALRTISWMIAGEVACCILHGDRNEGAGPSGFPPEVSFLPWQVGRELSPSQDYKALRELQQVVEKLQPDLIHAHSSKAGALVRLAFPSGRIPVIYSPHGYSFLRRDLGIGKRMLYWSLERALGFLPQVTVACGVTEYGYAQAVSRRSLCIPNSINLADLQNAREARSQSEGERLLIGSVGGIRPQKNFGLFCEVATALAGSGMEFIWIGGGEVPAKLYPLPPNLTITGWLERDEALAKLASCDAYMQTSLWEGLSLAVLEGMALGLPILATPAPGNTELVIDGHNGYICAQAKEFSRRLEELKSSPDLRTAMGGAARRDIELRFSVEQAAPRWLSLYKNYERYRTYG